MSTPRRHLSGDCLIDLDAREIRRGEAAVDVEAKVFDLIALLLENRDRALSKREIGDALWGNRPVTDAALSQLLRKARRALGDDGDAQRVIRTVHGRGLQWVAPVTGAEEMLPPAIEPATAADVPLPPPPAARIAVPLTRRRWPWLAAAAVVLAALAVFASAMLRGNRNGAQAAEGVPRVAVLPVRDRTGEADAQWLSQGLMGLMSGLIGQPSVVEAVPAADVAAVAKEGDDTQRLAALARATGATHVLAAELSKVGTVYRLDVRLLGTDGSERRDSLHGSAPAALAADAVARAQTWLHGRPNPALAADAGIRDPFLAQAYARGLDAQLRGDNAGAKKYFDICVDHDPQLLRPRLQLAVAQGLTDEADASVENATRVATAARERGDGELFVEAQRLLAAAAYRRGEMEVSARHLDDALAHVPPGAPARLTIDLLVGYGSIDDERGRPRDARLHLERALALARESRDRRREANVLTNLAAVENTEGDAERALARLREGLDVARAAGDGYLEGATLGNLGAAEFNAGRVVPAIALLRQGLAVAHARNDRQLTVLTAVLLSWALATFDLDEPAARLAQQALAVGERDDNAYWQAEAQWALANLAAHRQDWPQALDRYDRARGLYERGAMQRNAAQVLAETVEAAVRAGQAPRAHAAADSYRRLAAEEAGDAQLAARLPIIDAQLRWAEGDRAGATAALAQFLDARGNDRGPAAQAAIFQLGRWQVELGQGDALLRRAEWTSWLGQHPVAIGLRIAALDATGQADAANAERARLAALRASPELAIEPALLAAPN